MQCEMAPDHRFRGGARPNPSGRGGVAAGNSRRLSRRLSSSDHASRGAQRCYDSSSILVCDTRDPLCAAAPQFFNTPLVTSADLGAVLERHRGRAGVRRLRAVLAAEVGPALTDSEAEEHFLSVVDRGGLARPEVNVPVAGYRVDFLFRAQRLAVEIDGYRYHSSRPRFESDRRRAACLAGRGIQVVSLTWRQVVEDPVRTAVQFAQALARAEERGGAEARGG